MYRGRIVEMGDTEALFAKPAHPYTRELVDATPRLDLPTRAPVALSERDALIVAALVERGGAVNYRSYTPPPERRPGNSRGLPLCGALRVRPPALPYGSAEP